MLYSAKILTIAALLACWGCGGTGNTVEGSSTNSSQLFSNSDLDGFWQGVAVPVDPLDLPLELTLGFESFGNAPDQVQLIHYSFPEPRSTGTVDYLSLLTTYEIFYSSSGRLTLETRYLGLGSEGRFVDETITKILLMDDDLQTMVGTENIRVYEAGSLSIAVDSVLRLDRLD
ncbi:MAG: hypothetical protein ACYSU1_00210 [Planctomycetota bacterium]